MLNNWDYTATLLRLKLIIYYRKSDFKKEKTAISLANIRIIF